MFELCCYLLLLFSCRNVKNSQISDQDSKFTNKQKLSLEKVLRVKCPWIPTPLTKLLIVTSCDKIKYYFLSINNYFYRKSTIYDLTNVHSFLFLSCLFGVLRHQNSPFFPRLFSKPYRISKWSLELFTYVIAP